MKNKKGTYILDIIQGQIYLQIAKERESIRMEMKENNRLQHQQPQQQQQQQQPQLEAAAETKEETLMMRTK